MQPSLEISLVELASVHFIAVREAGGRRALRELFAPAEWRINWGRRSRRLAAALDRARCNSYRRNCRHSRDGLWLDRLRFNDLSNPHGRHESCQRAAMTRA